MKNINFLLFALIILFASDLEGQNKRDYQWIIGYDTSQLDPGGDAILLNFNTSILEISNIKTVDNFHMEGSNTSMCDNSGNILFYSNGCYIVNSKNEIMMNGDSINPGFMQDVWCPFGGSWMKQGVIAIPAPENNCLHYVFNLDLDQPYILDTMYAGLAPQRLFYQTIDMTQDSGYGAVIQKNQIAVQDTFSRGNIQAVRHANGIDWWVIVPKSHSNCYFLVPVTAEGVQTAQLKCSGINWTDDDSGQAVFSPDGNKYVRFNWWNGLNIFDFNNETGELSNPIVLEFPNDTINATSGVAISPNSRFLYVSARKKVYQFDLQAVDIESSKILIAEWDGYTNPAATLFYLSALGPDGKIYISSTGSTKNLHVIHNPDMHGLDCNLEQHGIELPSWNFASIPNLPHYANQSTPMDCDSIVNTSSISKSLEKIEVYPNPTKDYITIELNEIEKDVYLELYDLLGQKKLETQLVNKINQINLSVLEVGFYIIKISSNKILVSQRKIIKKE